MRLTLPAILDLECKFMLNGIPLAMTIAKILKRVRLNLRAAKLALTGRWLTPGDVAASYDALASSYHDNWLTHLCRTTDRLHDLLPANDAPTMRIIDLGCGTGYSTAFLANKYPTASITAVDISGEMLNQAKASPGEVARVQFVQGDMLRYLESQPGQSCDLVFSAWAIGYSVPAKIIAESHRVLRPGGTLAAIVNRLGTMPAVFAAFRKTMRAFPESLEKAVWPRFPRGIDEIKSYLNRHAFTVELLEEGIVPITPPEPGNQASNQPGKRLDWLLGTGVLAGFDSVLPIGRSATPKPTAIPGENRPPFHEMRRFFERELDTATTGWEHHYLMFLAAECTEFHGK